MSLNPFKSVHLRSEAADEKGGAELLILVLEKMPGSIKKPRNQVISEYGAHKTVKTESWHI